MSFFLNPQKKKKKKRIIHVKHLVAAKKQKSLYIYKNKANDFLVFLCDRVHKSQHSIIQLV